ncbi:hypothetical protein sscle_03g031320 [Sclerotinia sclerotiorum 1980 UF-70]|uniref:Uncharacterized protein n=1 Tax=Sclerotinia sclerotiorum (strain ATCC 18683 / 1980 / Ss-1) TaxID=665079 RepID=A0A1D9Q0M8_SCLS1|nr:hypothetical protein sscle_03g031320 [Sclerotinia sclerotiorum 1980 UF-70]
MTSNKHKRSTPRKSPQNPSPHKHHKPHKSHKNSQEKVKQLTPNSSNSPILPPKNAKAARQILPPTRRVLFPQNAKLENSQQSFSSPLPIKKDHLKTGKHDLSSPAVKLSDNRPFKKQCISSPSPAKNVKLMPRESNGVDWRAGMNISSDDDEDKDEEGTPSPPSRRRKADITKGAWEGQKKPALAVLAPPKAAISYATPLKQHCSSIYAAQPNSTAINKIDITVLRLEKGELQNHLDTSIQQTQQAMNDVKKWETKCKASIDAQETLNRLLNAEMKEKENLQSRISAFTQQAHELKLAAETWEKKWKVTTEENNSLRKQLASKTKEHSTAELNTEQWQHQHRVEIDKNTKLQRELKLKHVRDRHEKDHIEESHQFANKIIQLEEEPSQLKSQNSKMSFKTEREEYLEATNKLLAKQVAQLKEEIYVQHKSTLEKQDTELRGEVILQNSVEKSSESDIRRQDNNNSDAAEEIARVQVQESLPKPHDESSQTPQTHLEEISTHHLTTRQTHQTTHQPHQTQPQKINHNQDHQNQNQISAHQKEISTHQKQITSLKQEIQKLEEINKYKDIGLEKMGLLVAGWALKWRGLGGEGVGKIDGEGREGNRVEGKIPAVEGLGVCVNGVRM